MILITGSAGFIGKRLTVLAKKTFKKEKIFCVDKNNFDLIKDDLSDLPKNPRIIFHLAAVTDTAVSGHEMNAIMMKNLLSAIKPGPKTHFIYTSTQAVFSGRIDTKKPITEKTKASPNNRYGKYKLDAEKTLLNAAGKQKFKVTIVRLPTVLGDNPRKNSFMNLLKKMVKDGSVLSRFDWPGKVGLIARDDVCNFLINTSQKASAKPKTISICAQNLTLAEIFKVLTEARGKKYEQIKIPGFIWRLAVVLRPNMKYFEPLMPSYIYNVFWRASIVVDSPLWCKENVKGERFGSV